MSVEIPSEGDPPAQSSSDKPSSAESNSSHSHPLEKHPLERRYNQIVSELEEHFSDKNAHGGMTKEYTPIPPRDVLWSYNECEECAILVRRALRVDKKLRRLSLLIQTYLSFQP